MNEVTNRINYDEHRYLYHLKRMLCHGSGESSQGEHLFRSFGSSMTKFLKYSVHKYCGLFEHSACSFARLGGSTCSIVLVNCIQVRRSRKVQMARSDDACLDHLLLYVLVHIVLCFRRESTSSISATFALEDSCALTITMTTIVKQTLNR